MMWGGARVGRAGAWAALVLNLVIFVLCFFIVERESEVWGEETEPLRRLVQARAARLKVSALTDC
jgi:hypothetical protein